MGRGLGVEDAVVEGESDAPVGRLARPGGEAGAGRQNRARGHREGANRVHYSMVASLHQTVVEGTGMTTPGIGSGII